MTESKFNLLNLRRAKKTYQVKQNIVGRLSEPGQVNLVASMSGLDECWRAKMGIKPVLLVEVPP